MRKQGVVVHTKPEKGYSLVRVGPVSSLEVYFLPHRLIHSTEIIGVGTLIEFESRPGEKEGQRPVAWKPEIVETICGARLGNDVCQREKGHEGKHKDNESWTDADAVQYAAKLRGK
jgi:hypothetical protein